MLYFDTTYLFRVYSTEPGHDQVKALLRDTDKIAIAWHGRAEFASILLRKRREGADTPEQLASLRNQFQADCELGLIDFLPLSEAVMTRLEYVLESAPPETHIRAADALHLACAAEHGFTEVYSNDRHFLTAAPLFGLRGVNVIPLLPIFRIMLVPKPKDQLPWTRFWSPRNSRDHKPSREFLEDPYDAYAKYLLEKSDATPLAEILPKTGLLVLCGEPGLGKSTELRTLADELSKGTKATEKLIYLEARQFDSFPDLQNHLEVLDLWQAWLIDQQRTTIFLDGLDEGLIRMPTLVGRFRNYLENKPTPHLRLLLTCRSFEWPETEGARLASLWSEERESGYIYELEPLRRKDAALAAEARGHNGDDFLKSVDRSDVATLASRPITLSFLLREFDGNGFSTTSRRQLYKNGCRRLCDDEGHNPDRTRLLRHYSTGDKCSVDDILTSAGKLACALLLGGTHRIRLSDSPSILDLEANIRHARNLIDPGLISKNQIEQVLGTGLVTVANDGSFGFAHQTFAECLGGQFLSTLPLSQLRTLTCATDQTTNSEFVIPQLVELAAWIAGENSDYFKHLLAIDPATLLRCGISFSDNEQKAALVQRILELASNNQLFDESGYWRYWTDINHPQLPQQLEEVLVNPYTNRTTRRIAVSIAKACHSQALIPTLFQILRTTDDDQYYRSAVADALCTCMPDDRLAELEPLVRGEVGSDPDQSILGHALLRLVPTHYSVSDILQFIGFTSDPHFHGSYWRALSELHHHLSEDDILPSLQALWKWEGDFSDTSFRRELCMGILLQALELIDAPTISGELVKLWKQKSANYHPFFRDSSYGVSKDIKMSDASRRKWVAAIIESDNDQTNTWIYNLTSDTYRLIEWDDFGWLLDKLLEASNAYASNWAKLVANVVWNDQARVTWWNKFLEAYRRSSALRTQMPWFEITSISAPERRNAKAQWLRSKRRSEKYKTQRLKASTRLNPGKEIAKAFSRIKLGQSWAFMNLCHALSIREDGSFLNHLDHDITVYPGWINLSKKEQSDVIKAARKFLLEKSDGWDELGTKTNYSDPGAAAIWLLRHEIEFNSSLKTAIGASWSQCILGMWGSSEDAPQELFALLYRINPERAIYGWIREIRADIHRHRHAFAIRRAKKCWDDTLARELIDLIKVLKDPKSLRSALEELKVLDVELTGELSAYLLSQEIYKRIKSQDRFKELAIAGLGTGSHRVWTLTFPVLTKCPSLGKQIMLSIASDVDSRLSAPCKKLSEEELGDLYLLLCRYFPYTEDPELEGGFVTPRQSAVYFRSSVIDTLCSHATMDACAQLKRLANVLPPQSAWLHRRHQQTLGLIRRNKWTPFSLSEIATVLKESHKRLIRDTNDLMSLILESLEALQRNLNNTTLPAVEDLWMWQGGGLKRKDFRHKDEEAISDYICRWLRDRIGPKSKVVVNREVQPERRHRTDILVQAWSQTPKGRLRQEEPLSVTIEVKGCWNPEVHTGAKEQLLEQYLRPYGLTHGIFLVAWFHSPYFDKIAPNQTSQLKYESYTEAQKKLVTYVNPAQISGFAITPVLLDCRLTD